MRDAVRVALLARPGVGADRLREALQAAGAELVLDADPTTLEPSAFSAARAESVVVLLDSAVEDALDRLDPVLHDPAIDVLYEEAEVAAAREGWDAARWTRHLSAKLMRHDDVLPPGREADGARAPDPEPAHAPPPSEAAPEPAAPLPVDRSAPEPVAPPAPAAPAPSMFDPVAAEYDDPSPDLSLPEPPPDPAPDAVADAVAEPSPDPDWSALALSLDGEAPPVGPAADAGPEPPEHIHAAQPAQPPTPELAPHAGRGDAIRDFRRDLADIEQRIASMGLVADDRPQPAPEASAGPPAESSPGPSAEPAPPDAAGPPIPDPAGSGEAPALADEAPAAAPAPAATGAVLVFAGIGGPDAVRQFLGALPDAFPRPVLIHQRLDGGRHDRLVQQMARATTLPVHLAEVDEVVEPGHVYVLPPGLRLVEADGGLRFAAGDDPMATLPAAQSAVLMFSGSDTALVDAAMHHARAGALVAGQSPEDCYDAAAADALVALGAQSGQPAELARRLVERWAA